jgi:hypothetical protein
MGMVKASFWGPSLAVVWIAGDARVGMWASERPRDTPHVSEPSCCPLVSLYHSIYLPPQNIPSLFPLTAPSSCSAARTLRGTGARCRCPPPTPTTGAPGRGTSPVIVSQSARLHSVGLVTSHTTGEQDGCTLAPTDGPNRKATDPTDSQTRPRPTCHWNPGVIVREILSTLRVMGCRLASKMR